MHANYAPSNLYTCAESLHGLGLGNLTGAIEGMKKGQTDRHREAGIGWSEPLDGETAAAPWGLNVLLYRVERGDCTWLNKEASLANLGRNSFCSRAVVGHNHGSGELQVGIVCIYYQQPEKCSAIWLSLAQGRLRHSQGSFGAP